MPTYDYRCENCGHKMEAFQPIKDDPLTLCPNCNTNSLKRIIGAGAGLIFKGSGFYLTDYKNTTQKETSKNTKSTSKKSDADKSSAKNSDSSTSTDN
ncbi:MAG: zinc ribbon domain-containing protein [Ignavibacteriaceae bacterium]|jgi:putative regulatory protein, FmdB family|nr:MAG: zinc ribbon domain-containing protein [Chlorobiota bacterium]KXK06141.1 MAG: regulatory protein, FmdB family [Chlorobi bacterium OLB4]MBV6398569.1 hypothetical protein [Ignavibacteria bacterium]MCC6885803.1 zinc ribbon domain-containing protein [Ignavibacteriales bacterium]MCE7953002.1 zinc ribbon domain-containing protein [Chlorobi bacterium CHB7]MDL1887160.1 zinc ribbon domain-containing protein [Ignavibacteria bacterium CHB1]MEB2329215.1 zinc ribbon domain-containing protein [Ignav